MLRNATRGTTAPLRALLLLINHPHLRRLAIFPFLINVALFVVGIPLAIWGSWSLIDSWIDDTAWWLFGLAFLAKFIAIFIVIITSTLAFTLVGTVIAAPFNGVLALEVERHVWRRHGLDPPVVKERGWMIDSVRAMTYELGRMIFFLALFPLILATLLIPGIGALAYPIIMIAYGSFVLAVDFSDYTLDRRIDGFKDKLAYIWKRPSVYFCFGGASFTMLLIPFINLLVIPTCAAAGAILFVEDQIRESSEGLISLSNSPRQKPIE